MWSWHTSPLPYAGNHNHLRTARGQFQVVTVYLLAITVLIYMNESDGVISIETFSIITRLTRQALRLYDENELLTPARMGIICYKQRSHQQIRRGIQLKRLLDLGFGIREMRWIMDGKPASENALQPQALLSDRAMAESRILSG